MIFCESHFDFAAVKSLVYFLSTHKALSTIPFIVDAGKLNESDLNLYKNISWRMISCSSMNLPKQVCSAKCVS